MFNHRCPVKDRADTIANDCVFFECSPGFGKCLGHRHFLEEGDRENLEQSVEGASKARRFLTMAMRTTDTAIQICIFTVLSDMP